MRIVFAAIILSAIAQSCDPVKRVLRDSGKTREVASEYLKQFPFKDSIVYRPGKDTTILRDTTLHDTTWLAKPVPYQVTNTRVVEKLVVDTSAIYDRANLRAMQDILKYKDSLITVLLVEKSAERKRGNKFMWMFIGTWTLIAAAVTFLVLRKLRVI